MYGGERKELNRLHLVMVEGLFRLCFTPYVTDKVLSFVRESAARTFDSPVSNIGPFQTISDNAVIGDKWQESDPQANTAASKNSFLVWSATSNLFGLSSITDSTSTKSGVSLYKVDEEPTMILLPATTMFLSVSDDTVRQKERQYTAAIWSNKQSTTLAILGILLTEVS